VGAHAVPRVTPRPVVTQAHAGSAWTLVHDVVVSDPERGSAFRIPAGFVCDLASIPKALRWAIDKEDLGLGAPIAHDWLYRHGGRVPQRGRRPAIGYSRADADALFLALLSADGVPWRRRMAAYWAVRAAGRFAWRTSPEPQDRPMTDGDKVQAVLAGPLGGTSPDVPGERAA
jgi:hypothetical protein